MRRLASLVTDCPDGGCRPFVALENVESGTGRLTLGELDERDAPDAGAAAVEPGFVLFGKLRPYLAKTWLVDRPIYASTELLALRPEGGVDSRWLAYLCSSRPLIQWAVATSDGTKMPRTSWEKLGAFRVDVPPPREQREIADFLDAEAARIDALIEKKHRLIHALEERFIALVSAMTLQGSRKIRLRRLFERPVGGTWGNPPGESEVDGMCIRGTDFDMRTFRVDPSRAPTRSVSGYEFGLRRLAVGDIVVEKSGGGDQQPVGRAVLFDLDHRAFPTNFAARLRPASGELGDFLVYLLAACYASGATRSAIKQTTGIQNLDMDAFLATRAATCEQEDEIHVVRELDKERSRARELTSAIDTQIALLRERRQALITAAVTGQLDVSKAAV